MGSAAKAMAMCAMMCALCVVLMVLGAVLELGMYAAPLFAGLCFLPIGQKYGRKYQTVVYVASSLLCFLLVPNLEENLMLAGFFGWYPVVRPWLEKLPKLLRWPVKLVIFNSAVIAIEWLVIAVLAPEALSAAILWALLALGNVLFFAYDLLIPKMEFLLGRILKFL